MTSSIEKSLARLDSKMTAIERKLDAMANAVPSPSAFAAIRSESLGEVMSAAAIDNLTSAAARLRAFHGASDEMQSAARPANPFGKPASSAKVIDVEFSEIKSRENDHGAA